MLKLDAEGANGVTILELLELTAQEFSHPPKSL
jgi:hypothetical protein